MTFPLALLLLTAAQSAPPRTPLPGPADAAAAFFQREAFICLMMIDACVDGIAMLSPGQMTDLSCRTGRRGFASCRFSVTGVRCRAKFVRAAAGAAHRWARQWSLSPARPGQVWTAAWTVSPAPRGPRVWCEGDDPRLSSAGGEPSRE